MKKSCLIILSVLIFLTLIVWFSCNPFSSSSHDSASLNILDETDFVKATGISGGFGNNASGGEGGATVYASDYETFKSYTDSNDTLIIYVTNSFNLSSMDCHIRSNKTVIGQGPNIVLSGGGLYLYRSDNVIIRNLTIRGSSEDNIGIHYSTNIWIDHCTFYDSSDGAIDITQASDYITVSWCKFYYSSNNGHDFVSLIAASDSDDGSQYHVTYHHNWWSTLCIERMPSVRFGRVHCYNNYYNAPGNNYCIRTRVEAELLVENNYFENVQNPWELYITSGTPGKLRASGNVLINTTTYTSSDRLIPAGTDSVFTPSYSYTLDSASGVKSSVMAGAGPK